jgi:hypothetical protein
MCWSRSCNASTMVGAYTVLPLVVKMALNGAPPPPPVDTLRAMVTDPPAVSATPGSASVVRTRRLQTTVRVGATRDSVLDVQGASQHTGGGGRGTRSTARSRRTEPRGDGGGGGIEHTSTCCAACATAWTGLATMARQRCLSTAACVRGCMRAALRSLCATLMVCIQLHQRLYHLHPRHWLLPVLSHAAAVANLLRANQLKSTRGRACIVDVAHKRRPPARASSATLQRHLRQVAHTSTASGVWRCGRGVRWMRGLTTLQLGRATLCPVARFQQACDPVKKVERLIVYPDSGRGFDLTGN